jgi:hypothetical protein
MRALQVHEKNWVGGADDTIVVTAPRWTAADEAAYQNEMAGLANFMSSCALGEPVCGIGLLFDFFGSSQGSSPMPWEAIVYDALGNYTGY